jgi:hypothetical protein
VLARRPLAGLTAHVGDEGVLIESGATVGADHVLLAVADPEDPDEVEHHVLLDAGTLETVGRLDYGSPMRIYSLVGAQGARWLTQEGPDEPARLWELPSHLG